MGWKGIVLIINYYPMVAKRSFQLLGKYVLAKWFIKIYKILYRFRIIMKLLLGIILFCFFCSPLLFYYFEFCEYPRSYDHESWGQFGDYVGGVFNPILTLISIVITGYIASIANRINKEQNRPYCNIILNDYENYVSLDIENVGNGPLIIKSFSIYDSKDGINIPVLELLPPNQDNEFWNNYIEMANDRAISVGGRIKIIELKLDPKQQQKRVVMRDALRVALAGKTISVEYSDIHNSRMPVKIRNLDFYGRHTVKESKEL